MGRQKGYRKPTEQYLREYQTELRLLANGVSMRQVSKLTGRSVNTLAKLKKYI